eukprot:2623859-Prorocentrum_lima.AAC.1
MVIVRKFLTPRQMKETGTTKTWKAKTHMVICGIFASESQALCDSTSTQNVDIGLLLSLIHISEPTRLDVI